MMSRPTVAQDYVPKTELSNNPFWDQVNDTKKQESDQKIGQDKDRNPPNDLVLGQC